MSEVVQPTLYTPRPFRDFDRATVEAIVEHFRLRFDVSKRLQELVRSRRSLAYAHVALGVSDDGRGNYSASEHAIHIGRRILEEATPRDVVRLARTLLSIPRCEEVPEVVEQAKIRYLKTSVGSEMGCMLRPAEFWITNRRTAYAHVLQICGDDRRKANDHIKVVSPTQDIEGTYDYWGEWHPRIGHVMIALAEAGRREFAPLPATLTRLIDRARFLWADAIASMIYEWREW